MGSPYPGNYTGGVLPDVLVLLMGLPQEVPSPSPKIPEIHTVLNGMKCVGVAKTLSFAAHQQSSRFPSDCLDPGK